MAVDAKVAKLERDIVDARLRADYSSLPTLLKKWAKRAAHDASAQTLILEQVCAAEPLLLGLPHVWSLVAGSTDTHAYNTTAAGSASNGTNAEVPPQQPTATATATAAAAQLIAKAYNQFLANNRLAAAGPAAAPHADLPAPTPDLATARPQFSRSQLYLELLVLKAKILHLRGDRDAALAVLSDELELPPTDPDLILSEMGVVYLLEALVMKVDCIHAKLNAAGTTPETTSAQDWDAADQCLRYLLHFYPSSADPALFEATTERPLPKSTVVPFELPLPAALYESAHVRGIASHGLFLGGVRWLSAWFERLLDGSRRSDTITTTTATAVAGGGSGFSDVVSQSGQSSLVPSRQATPDLPPSMDPSFLRDSDTPSSASLSSFPALAGATAGTHQQHRQQHQLQHQRQPSMLYFSLNGVPFPALTYQALDFIRAYFAATFGRNLAQTTFLAAWAVRFLVVWSHVVVQVGAAPSMGPISDHMYAEYIPAVSGDWVTIKSDGGRAWRADDMYSELESVFRAWSDAVVGMYGFPAASSTEWPPARVNKLQEDLVATLEWSDGLLGVKDFSIDLYETALRYTFHSLLGHRVLAATHFRLGNIRQGLALLRRYIELAQSSRWSKVPTFLPWIYPTAQATLSSMYLQLGLARESMFVEHDDGINEYARLLVEGSQKLAECSEMPEALALARRAHKLIKSTPQPTSAVTCAILDNLGTILGLAAQSTFDPTEQQKLQLSAVQMLEESLAIDRASPRSHYQLALILAEQGQLGAAKAHVKMTLKANKGHVAAWHLLVLILTAARDLEGAVKLAELGVRESVAALIPFSSGTHTGGMAKSNTFDALAMLANDQAQNGTWAPAEYDAVMAAVFDLRLAQVRVIEQVRGVEAAVAVIQEMFRWFKRVFAVERSTADPDAATVAAAAAAAIAAGGSGTGSVNGVVGSRPSTSGGGTFSSGSPLPSVGGGVDDPLGSAGNGGGSDGAAGTAARNRAESVRSTASAWSLATPSVGGVAAITLRIKHARKRTMLTAALTNASGSDSGGADGQLPSSSASGSRTGNGSLSSVRRGTATEYGGGGARARGHSAGSVTSLAVSETNSGLDAAVPDALRSSAVRAATLAKLWLRLAQVLLNNGQLGPVPSLLKEAANLAPGDPRVDEEIAAAEYALGDTAAAVARWHGLLARNPHHLAALVGLARVALEHGRSADAELLLDDVTRHAGRASVDAWYLLGRVCKAQRDPERALACFQRALDLERAEPVHPFADVPRLSLVTLL